MQPIEQTLADREKTYGRFTLHAKITQNIKRAMEDSKNWAGLSNDQKECLEMVAHKIGRILNGDPNYADNWHDIAGYATLVENALPNKPQQTYNKLVAEKQQREEMGRWAADAAAAMPDVELPASLLEQISRDLLCDPDGLLATPTAEEVYGAAKKMREDFDANTALKERGINPRYPHDFIPGTHKG